MVAAHTERLAGLIVLALNLALAFGCAARARPPVNKPRLDPVSLAREADAELDRGCYVCLRLAAEKYEAAIAAGARSIEIKAAGAWTLVAVRERELGLKPSEAMERARSHRIDPSSSAYAPSRATNEIIDAYLLIASRLPLLSEGVSKEAMGGAVQAARRIAGLPAKDPDASPGAGLSMMRERAGRGEDRTAEYLLRSEDCLQRALAVRGGSGAVTEPEVPAANQRLSGLMTFRAATCGPGSDPQRDIGPLEQLVSDDPRFHEAHYFLGRLRLAERRLVSAEREFLAAADGVPAMTAAWAMLGVTRLALEEYDWAAADLGRALDLEPAQREALLSRAKALNYAGRFEEAMVPANRLIELGAWYLSDANYWLAFSELQLGRLQDANTHVREARRTNPMNGDTARLSGLVAYRLAQFERAQAEFELAISRNDSDCESRLHLGMIHGQKERFDLSVVEFVRARSCYAGLVESSATRKAEIEASSLSGTRRELALARLALRVAAYRRSQAAASYGAAEGEAQRGAYDAALEHASDAALHADFGARAAELRTRIAALRARGTRSNRYFRVR